MRRKIWKTTISNRVLSGLISLFILISSFLPAGASELQATFITGALLKNQPVLFEQYSFSELRDVIVDIIFVNETPYVLIDYSSCVSKTTLPAKKRPASSTDTDARQSIIPSPITAQASGSNGGFSGSIIQSHAARNPFTAITSNDRHIGTCNTTERSTLSMMRAMHVLARGDPGSGAGGLEHTSYSYYINPIKQPNLAANALVRFFYDYNENINEQGGDHTCNLSESGIKENALSTKESINQKGGN